jgi:hypothetical protein
MAARKKKAAGGGRQNKSAFVRSLPPDTPAKDVVEAAKAKGMTMSVAYVYTIRTAARAKGRRGQVPGLPGRRPGARSGGPVEDLLRAVAAELGLSRALAILEGEQATVRAMLGAYGRVFDAPSIGVT